MAFGVAIALMYYGRSFCITLVISVILAFLLEPFVVLVMRLRIPRGVSSFIVCFVALLALYSAGFMIFSATCRLQRRSALLQQTSERAGGQCRGPAAAGREERIQINCSETISAAEPPRRPRRTPEAAATKRSASATSSSAGSANSPGATIDIFQRAWIFKSLLQHPA